MNKTGIMSFDNVYIQVKYVLMSAWDPIGISHYDNANDEYDKYAHKISEMILSGCGTYEIQRYLYECSKTEMGLDYLELGKKSWDAAQKIMEKI